MRQDQNQTTNRAAYSPAEFAATCGRHPSWAYRLLYANKVRAVTELGRILIPATELQRVLSSAQPYDPKPKPKHEPKLDREPKPEAEQEEAGQPLRAGELQCLPGTLCPRRRRKRALRLRVGLRKGITDRCRKNFGMTDRFRQIAREGNAAIYEQTWNGCAEPSPFWEVIRIRRREVFRIGGRFVEPAEVYPKSEAWDVDGFTLIDKDAAFAKLRELA